jgi:four helix bundle protein
LGAAVLVESYRELDVWRKAIRLVRGIYELTRSMPDSERYGLISQMQRAAVSVPANIAEGCARDHTKEFLRHLSIARGSLAELETFLIIAHQLGYITLEQGELLSQQANEIGRMLNGLQQSLKAKLK